MNKDKIKLIEWSTNIDGVKAVRMLFFYEGYVIASSLLSGVDKVDPVIYDLYTHESYRRKGICFDMVKHWEQVIKNRKGFEQKQVYLIVSNLNEMIKTYKKWGFVLTGGSEKNGSLWMCKQL